MIIVQDAETGEQLYVDSSDPEFRARLHAAGETREVELKRALAGTGIDLHDIYTEEDLVGALVRIIESRKFRRR